MGKRVALFTLGCKVNQYETEAMRAKFMQAGYENVQFEDEADVYVVNTCTVTAVSDKKSRQMIARAHAKNANAIIAVVGCYSQSSPEAVSALPGVQLVLGTKERDKIVEHVEDAANQKITRVVDIAKEKTFEILPMDGSTERSRAQLKIQDGCDRFCSYCIIPHVRGPVRSLPLDDVKKSAVAFARAGYREIVLTGIHLMSYGKEKNNAFTLIDAVLAVASVQGIDRIRLGSLEPALIDETFAKALASEKKVQHQFHLSMQSGSDTVLKRMNRRYTKDVYREAVAALRNAMPEAAITTDVIAGFVAETEEEHRDTCAFVEEIGFSRIHVFPYSIREGTKAAQMQGHLSKDIKTKRAKELSIIGERLAADFVSRNIDRVENVLVERVENGVAGGYTGNYIPVTFECGDIAEGEIVAVKIVRADQENAIAERLYVHN